MSDETIEKKKSGKVSIEAILSGQLPILILLWILILIVEVENEGVEFLEHPFGTRKAQKLSLDRLLKESDKSQFVGYVLWDW